MKKKYRDIVVNNIHYAWSISNVNGDGDGGKQLNIWKEKTKIYTEWLKPEIVITPKTISYIISDNDLQ
jgi:hypothetical protein